MRARTNKPNAYQILIAASPNIPGIRKFHNSITTAPNIAMITIHKRIIINPFAFMFIVLVVILLIFYVSQFTIFIEYSTCADNREEEIF